MSDYTSTTEGLFAEIETPKGKIICNLTFDKTPMTVANFVGLAEGTIENSNRKLGEPYFDNLSFHRVVDNFVIQGGCPLGTGTGGPGYNFPDEFDADLRHDRPGVLSMANAGPGTNGSQFFITHTPTPHLNDRHSVFGYVVEGMDVVNSIKQGDKINSIKIMRKGENAEKFKIDTQSFKDLILNAADHAKKRAEAAQKEKLDYIEKTWPNLTITESGLRYKVIQEGDGGESPKRGDQISCHYNGTLLNGQKFDSSYDRGEPLEFAIGQVIQGWNEALMMMTKGEKRLLVIPPELGYGANGIGPIPPNSFLVFEVELLDFKK